MERVEEGNIGKEKSSSRGGLIKMHGVLGMGNLSPGWSKCSGARPTDGSSKSLSWDLSPKSHAGQHPRVDGMPL